MVDDDRTTAWSPTGGIIGVRGSGPVRYTVMTSVEYAVFGFYIFSCFSITLSDFLKTCYEVS